MKHPDEFLNRVAVYKKEQNTGELEDRTVVIDSKLVNQFQKAITEFNDRIVKGKDSPTQDELFQQLPMTEMEEDKYKFSKPSHMSHTNMIDIQVGFI